MVSVTLRFLAYGDYTKKAVFKEIYYSNKNKAEQSILFPCSSIIEGIQLDLFKSKLIIGE